MTKNNKLFLGAFVLIGTGAYLIYRFVAKTKSGQNLTYSDSVKEDVKSATNAIKDVISTTASFPLKNGSKGTNVVVLQKWLNDKGYASPKLVTDGVFGAKTESAVKAMQENPYEKAIFDYNEKAIWNTGYSFGQISKDFYDKFIK